MAGELVRTRVRGFTLGSRVSYPMDCTTHLTHSFPFLDIFFYISLFSQRKEGEEGRVGGLIQKGLLHVYHFIMQFHISRLTLVNMKDGRHIVQSLLNVSVKI